ncbi:MAG: iron ABC transporter permease [Lentisphaeria bacterium]|nr:iron ABC transporter permease [Lentisphaeria bacterium]
MSRPRISPWLLYGALAALVLLVLALAPFAGIRTIPLRAVFDDGGLPLEYRIFWQMRVPRVLTAFIAGAALSLSGMCFQGLFRNVLATPFTLGVSGGASLGVAIYVRFGVSVGILGVSGMSTAAFLGALCAIALVYGLTRLRGNSSTAVMLLAGVAVSAFFSSLILFVQYLGDANDMFRVMRWLMGGLDAVDYPTLGAMAALCLLTTGVVISQVEALNLLAVGEEFAASRGVNRERSKLLFFFCVSLLVGGVVAICGPIGFVGMVCPHICRLLFGANHRVLAPASVLFGGAFLVICDTFGRCVVAPVEIPVGVITSLIGGPFFLWLLIRHDV